MSTATLDDALELVCQKFRGIVDKGGQPYILHCLRVMLAQQEDSYRQAAVLHDLVEDTDVTLQQLRDRGFKPEVVDAVDLLTHRDQDSYAQYVIRLASNPIAKSVKLADLHDNYRLDRVAYRADRAREDAPRIQKYILTYQFLAEQINERAYQQAMFDLDQNSQAHL